MNVVMLTNVYLPQVGGIQRSVAAFSEALRALGHNVLVVAPTDPHAPPDEQNVVRVPALPDVTGSGFAMSVPVPGYLANTLDEFEPDIVHAHQPLLLGATAVRIATVRNVPLAFTYHTRYEFYTHEALDDFRTLRDFMVELADAFMTLCDGVVAPSESIKSMLIRRGATARIEAIPTGVRPGRYATGDGAGLRRRLEIPADAFLVGHVGRLVPEKNVAFLGRAVARLLRDEPRARFLLVGDGDQRQNVLDACAAAGVAPRLHAPGNLVDQDLVDAYHAMDVFAFASHSETQGMVLAEALTAGAPIVAVDAPGAREAVRDGVNGRLIGSADETTMANALRDIMQLPESQRSAMAAAARNHAENYVLDACAERLVAFYEDLVRRNPLRREVENHPWMQTLRRAQAEWRVLSSRAAAAARTAGLL